MVGDTQPLEFRRQVQMARVAYLEGEVAELEARMTGLRSELIIVNWELAQAILDQAALERQRGSP